MKIGFTGTRNQVPPVQVDRLRRVLATGMLPWTATELHHGDCVGADAASHDVALEFRIPVVIHPPTDDRHRAFCHGAVLTMPPAPYLKRNRNIVNVTAMMIALPCGGELLRSGTWSTLRYARQLRRPIIIVWPDGTTSLENM